VGYLTSNPELTNDIDTVFQQLSSLTKLRTPRHLLLAPFNLQTQMVTLTQRVAEAARQGRSARIVVKANSLTDEVLVHELIRAGQAGASIDLIVRGACILPPGLAGLTDHIRVRSVVGRMLEHTRVFYFRWGDAEHEEQLYLSSADWMNRNMTRRIEVAWPVRDPALRQRVIDECVVPYLLDARDAWQQMPDGRYERVPPTGHSAQQALMALHGVRHAVDM
jgi:polyphosphate kinase